MKSCGPWERAGCSPHCRTGNAPLLQKHILFEQIVGGGVRIPLKNTRMSGRHRVQYVAQCVAGAALTLVVLQ